MENGQDAVPMHGVEGDAANAANVGNNDIAMDMNEPPQADAAPQAKAAPKAKGRGKAAPRAKGAAKEAAGTKRAHQEFPLDTKKRCLDRYNKKEPVAKIARDEGVSRSTLHGWIIKADTIMENYANAQESNTAGTVIRVRPTKSDEVGNRLLKWFQFCVAINMKVPLGRVFVEKAKRLAKNLSEAGKPEWDFYKDWVPTSRWLDRWKKRHGIRFRGRKHAWSEVDRSRFKHLSMHVGV
jgi:hypothetical protein